MTFRNPDKAIKIATIIRAQIMTGDKWCLAAGGARDFMALDANENRRGGLQFRVTITNPRTHHKIVIELTHMDEYKVQRIKIKRGSHEVIIEEEETCYCDNLAAVVYGMCNKETHYGSHHKQSHTTDT